MIDSKILITIVGLLGTVYAVNALEDKKETKEHYTAGWGNQFALKVDREVAPNAQAARAGKFTSIQNNTRSMLNPEPSKAFYTVPGNFQSAITPRFFGGDYGANISYNLPSKKNLAVPQSPLDFANAASNVQLKEGYMPPNGNLKHNGGAPLMQPGYGTGNYNDELNKVYQGPSGGNMKSSHANLPVGDMTTLNSLGQEDQPIVYDRYMFANRNSRLRAGGDKIRGDLPIAPVNNGWFNVSIQPNIDLEQGAMNVMGGINNETTQQLADLIYTTSGKSKTVIAGTNMQNQLGNPATTKYANKRTNTYRRGSENQLNNTQMNNQYNMNLSAGGGDVQVRAFP